MAAAEPGNGQRTRKNAIPERVKGSQIDQTMPKLIARKAETPKAPGMYSDGGSLYLCVAKAGTKSWILRTTVRGLTTPSGKPYCVELGDGSYRFVSLAEARQSLGVMLRLCLDKSYPSSWWIWQNGMARRCAALLSSS